MIYHLAHVGRTVDVSSKLNENVFLLNCTFEENSALEFGAAVAFDTPIFNVITADIVPMVVENR